MVALHVYVFLLVVCLLLSLARLGRLCWFHLRPSSSRGRAKRTRLCCAHLSVVEPALTEVASLE